MAVIIHRHCVSVLLLVVLASGCVAPIKPNELNSPRDMTCIYLRDPISFTGQYGAFHASWTTRLERGPYWSEKIDGKGTYYRAPPGGVSITGAKGAGIPGQGAVSDGGFYVPSNSDEPIHIYRYFSTDSVPAQVPPDDLNCSNVAYSQDPSSSMVSLVTAAAAGAATGAAGEAISRGMIGRGAHMSYGRAAGVGAAGGLIGGLVVASIINSGIGKIIDGMPIQDPSLMGRLRQLAAASVPIKKFQDHKNPGAKVSPAANGGKVVSGAN